MESGIASRPPMRPQGAQIRCRRLDTHIERRHSIVAREQESDKRTRLAKVDQFARDPLSPGPREPSSCQWSCRRHRGSGAGHARGRCPLHTYAHEPQLGEQTRAPSERARLDGQRWMQAAAARRTTRAVVPGKVRSAMPFKEQRRHQAALRTIAGRPDNDHR